MSLDTMKTKSFLRQNSIVIFLLFISLFTISSYIQSQNTKHYWWTSDSAFYIEAARNHHKTAELIVSSDTLSETETEIVSLWPPGYPILLSIIHQFVPLDISWISLTLSVFSWMILPVCIYLFSKQIIEETTSFYLAIMVLSSPAAFWVGYVGLTDMPFLITVLIGFVLCRDLDSTENSVFVKTLLSGLLIGFSFTIRNAGAAALLSVFFSYIFYFLISKQQRKIIFKKLIVWSIGTSIFVLPLLLYNLKTFGKLQPYSMPPSTVSLLSNIRGYIHATFFEMFGSHELAILIGWDFLGLLSLSVIALSACLYYLFIYFDSTITRLKKILKEFIIPTNNAFTLTNIIFYSIFGIVIVIYARTKYEWGESINLRHVLQYNWAILIVAISLFLRLLKEHHAKIAIYVLCSLVVFGHFNYYLITYYNASETKNIKMTLKRQTYFNEALKNEIIQQTGNKVYIGSNFHDVLRIATGEMIHPYCDSKKELAESLKENLPKIQKLLKNKNQKGIIYIFSDPEKVDEIKNIKIPGITVQRQNDYLFKFHII